MRSLITGIAGFSAGHLAKLLLERGHEVAGLESVPVKHADLPAYFKDIDIYHGDIRDEDVLSKALNGFKPDSIFHLAAQSSVKVSFENPVETFSANLIGTLMLFETVGKLEFPVKIMVVSSSEIYGRLGPAECPVNEDHPIKPVNPYAVSKAAVDMLAYQYFKAYNMPIYIARSFSHSGPGQKTVGVLSDWAFQVAKIDLEISQPVIKVGNMDVSRDYTDVRDVVKAYLDLVEKGKPGESYNICSGIGYKLDTLLDIYRTFTSKKIKISVDQSRMRPIDLPILVGSYDKIQAHTGWKPAIPIEKTLKDSFDYWKSKLSEEF